MKQVRWGGCAFGRERCGRSGGRAAAEKSPDLRGIKCFFSRNQLLTKVDARASKVDARAESHQNGGIPPKVESRVRVS